MISQIKGVLIARRLETICKKLLIEEKEFRRKWRELII